MRVAAVGAAVLALVVAGVAASRSGQSTHSPADDAALAASRRTILAELPKLQAFVGTDRGLTWKKSVDPEVLADADFVRALNSGDSSGGPADDPKDPDDIGTTYAAMGLVKDADTFYSDAEGATNSDVTGFYDDQTGRLVVRGTAWTPLMEYTLVHELTHAIQDQNFDLSTLDSSTRTDDETILTVRAVVEGDAERVADDYYDRQSSSWQDQVDSADGSSPSSASPIVDVYGAMPYAFGEQFVMGLYDKGGNHAVDQAFRGPPTTSAQLLHPDKWLAGTMPAPTPPERPAAPAGDLADIGVLGQLGLWSAVDAAHPHLKDTAQLDGWLGDSYVSTDGDSGACFVDQIHFVGASQRATAVTFLRGWTDAQHITVTPDGPADLRLSACKK